MALHLGHDTEAKREKFVKAEISLGNILLFLGLLGSIGAGIWQGGLIQATLQEGIRSEAALRAGAIIGLQEQLKGLQTDVREIRGIIIEDRRKAG